MVDRFPHYYDEALNPEREALSPKIEALNPNKILRIAIDVVEVEPRSAYKAKPYSLESQVQRYLWAQGSDQPWEEGLTLRLLRAKGR